MANPKPSPAGKALKRFLSENGLSYGAFARLIGLAGHSTVSRLIDGHADPSIETAILIENATLGAVRTVDWRDPREVAKRLRSLRSRKREAA